MKKLIALFLSVTALLSIGLGGCPGQQALQQQIDSLTAKNLELARQIQTTQAQMKAVSGEFVQMKQLIAEVSNTVLAQKATLEQVTNQLTALKNTPHQKAPAVKTPARTRRR